MLVVRLHAILGSTRGIDGIDIILSYFVPSISGLPRLLTATRWRHATRTTVVPCTGLSLYLSILMHLAKPHCSKVNEYP